MEPLNDFVIVRKCEAREETTPSGIVLPGTASKQFAEAFVVAVGPGRPLMNGGHEKLGLEAGDVVLAPLQAMIDYDWLGERLSVVQGSSIVAVTSRKKERDKNVTPGPTC